MIRSRPSECTHAIRIFVYNDYVICALLYLGNYGNLLTRVKVEFVQIVYILLVMPLPSI